MASRPRLYLIAAIPLGLFALAVLAGLRFNPSPSEPVGLWRTTHRPLTRGSYVLLNEPLKQIAGVPGDTITVTPAGSLINGRLWPHSAPLKPQHWPYGTFTLGPHQYWLLGQHPASYDARYTGWTPDTLVQSTVEPLWVSK